MRKKGSILIGLLWCVAILSVVVVTVLRGSLLDLRMAKNQGDQIQAHYLALAGIEKAKALLYHEARDRRGTRINHTGELYNDPEQFRDQPLGRGLFRVIRPGQSSDEDEIVYGVSDEESRLNVNYTAAEELTRIEGIDEEIAAAIVDFRDRDSNVTQGGAETEEYMTMEPPSVPRNAPLRTIRELLMVRGIERELFLGEDTNQNGLLEPEEDDEDLSAPNDNGDGILDAGWSRWVTVDSSVQDVDAAGEARVNAQEAGEQELTEIEGITSQIAQAIVQYRGQNRIENLVNLLDVRAMQQPQGPQPSQQPNQGGNPGSPPGSPTPTGAPIQVQPQPGGSVSPGSSNPSQRVNPGQPQQGQPTPTGPPLIDEQLLMEIADRVTTLSTSVQAGAVNINTADATVLECLPGMTEELADALIRHRSSSGYFPNVAWLLKVEGFTKEILQQVAPRVTVRSETFRILSEGEVTSTGARKRIQAIVRVGSSSVQTLSYREDLQ